MRPLLIPRDPRSDGRAQGHQCRVMVIAPVLIARILGAVLVLTAALLAIPASVSATPAMIPLPPTETTTTYLHPPAGERPFGFDAREPFIDYEATAALGDPAFKIVTAYVAVGNRLDTLLPFRLTHLVLAHARNHLDPDAQAETFTETVPPIWKPALPDTDIAPHQVVGGYISWKVPWYVWPQEILYRYHGVAGSGLGHGWMLPLFTDLNAGHRFYLPVGFLFYRGIVGGYPDHTFRPDHPIRTGQFAKMLVLADSPYNKADFSYPAGYLEEARKRGLASWLSAVPTGTITRLQAAVAVAQAGKDILPTPPDGYELPFTDLPEITDNLRDELALLAYNKVVAGVSGTRFAPNATCSRGQAAKMLARILDPAAAGPEPETTTTTVHNGSTTTTSSSGK